MAFFGFVLAGAMVWALTLEQAREELRRFNPTSARLAVEANRHAPGYDYARHSAAVEALAAQIARVGVPTSTLDEATLRLVAGYRQAILANPVLDFDRILCVRRRVETPIFPKDPSGYRGGSDMPYTRRGLSRALGLLGLNAHNHMDLNRQGFTNDIAVLSDLRGAPKLETLWRPQGTEIVRDLDLDFDASRILFTSYRGTNNLLGVYELDLKGPAALTAPKLLSPEDGNYDIQWWDACYLPNREQIILLGTGAYQFLPCEDGNFPMCVLYRLDRRTGETIQLTFEQDSDYAPSVLNDGRVMYTRWEYSDLQHYFSRELMTMNPDGVGQLARYGSGGYFPTFFEMRAVPGDPHLLLTFAGGHHGRAEHGRMLLLDPTLARRYPFKYDPPDRTWGPTFHTLRIPAQTLPASETGFVHEFPGRGKPVEGDVCDLQVDNQFARGRPYFAHPWPLDAKHVICSAQTSREGRFGLYFVDVYDNMVLLAEAEDGQLFEPIPLAPRHRPPVIPDRRVKGAKTCSVHIADVYKGQGLAGVPRGTVKKLRVFAYHFCYHKTGGHVSLGLDKAEAGWDLKRVLGTADVEADGSVCFEMPANTPVSFQPLDENGAAVQLMRSWTVGMPGERVSCTGCHEDNRTSVETRRTIADLKYHRGEIQRLVPPDADGIRPWGFANELYPHLVTSCVGCHKSWTTPEAAYRAIHPFVRRGGAESELLTLTPMEFHVSTSPLVQMLAKGHHGAALTAEGRRQLTTWVDLNCPFYGSWSPKGFKTDSYLPGTTNQVARRKDLNCLYSGVTDDPESEYQQYAAKVAARLKNLKPGPVVGANATGTGVAAAVPTLPGWPMDAVRAAEAQSGRMDEVAPITVRTLVLGEGESMTFRRIPAGTYLMGSTNGYPDEVRRVVSVSQPFWIGEMEVMNEQYHAFDPSHDSRHQDQYGFDQVAPGHVGNHRRQPVVRVSWDEAAAFCRWLSEKCGVRARLPSEEEWEWAARAGTDSPFPWGSLDDDFGPWANLADRDVANMYSSWDLAAAVQRRRPYPHELNYPLHDARFADDWFTLNFVGRAKPNAWGLYDMHGNAAEWTSSGESGKRVVRGGSFASRPKDATSSFRQTYLPWQKVFDVGFRVVLEE
ncbi:MAG: SUMF1/EgtB/PvdO family nonheme iron enzyme [Kiritimatiellae bacterium]|nr:SUMF1/EgtB/PvdO family nonheme iron enzyme [Kiritimatiellia bacterium]